jgi:hypothetical protein
MKVNFFLVTELYMVTFEIFKMVFKQHIPYAVQFHSRRILLTMNCNDVKLNRKVCEMFLILK